MVKRGDCPDCPHILHAGLCDNFKDWARCPCTTRLSQTPQDRADDDDVVEKGRGDRWP